MPEFNYPIPNRSNFVPNEFLEDEDLPEGDIGSCSGVLPGGRPYLAESWFSEGAPLTTFFFSTEGLEDATANSLVDLLPTALAAHLIPAERRRLWQGDVHTIRDASGNQMFSLTFTVGMPD